jgi:Fic family protein
LDVLKSSEIEGEKLNYEQVRSSIAKRLGMDVANLVKSSRAIDGVVEMMLDATQNFKQALTEERLFEWHKVLFSGGQLPATSVGKYRTEEMQIVSGRIGHLNVHYEAPKPARVSQEMYEFLKWFNNKNGLNHILKSAISHFWFVTIHPFDDGNGRIARAISDMMLARSDNSSQRFYSMSAQILKERKKYYDILEKTQYGNGDIIGWLLWFLKCSPDTALRDIKDLLGKGILRQEHQGGRSTSYELVTLP